jgi:hypothetical protein
MQPAEVGYQDVMLICRNGHVITDLLDTHPEHGLGHCDRCGADTLDHCPTCGQRLPGSIYVPGMVPVGGRQAPHFCMQCGAAFPWTPRSPLASASEALRQLESLLHRLPLVARQLRVRQSDQPPFRIEAERDLEDLVRSLLPVYFDDIRPVSRTPRYALGTRMDFHLVPEAMALTVKCAATCSPEAALHTQWQEDAAFYDGRREVRTLVGLVYDPEGVVRDPERLESVHSTAGDALKRRLVIAF